MTRPLRLEFAGALYHITARGNRREEIYLDDEDRIGFLTLLGEVCHRFSDVCWNVRPDPVPAPFAVAPDTKLVRK